MIERILLAQRALADGQLDLAERLFRQVADTDERNAIAVVGLAQVALARGDRVAALELADRALAIDPDDAAAAAIRAGTGGVAGAEPSPDAAGAEPSDAEPPEAGAEPFEAGAELSEAPPSLRRRLIAWLRRLAGRPT